MICVTFTLFCEIHNNYSLHEMPCARIVVPFVYTFVLRRTDFIWRWSETADVTLRQDNYNLHVQLLSTTGLSMCTLTLNSRIK